MDAEQRYDAACEWLATRQASGVRLGLERVRRALDRIGNPHAGMKAVTIAGTNGKGSTAKFLASILHASGYRVGVYTSPHLVSVRERICIGTMQILPDQLTRWIERIRTVVEGRDGGAPIALTYFEVLTLVAIAHFDAREVDIAILEVGLGGRLDATAVVPPLVSVITRVGHDHQEILGETLEEICQEKAGIIHEGSTVVTNVSAALFRNVIGPIAFDRRCPIRRAGVDFIPQRIDTGFRYRGWINRVGPVRLGIPGAHQVENAALACAAAESLAAHGFYFKPTDIAEGLFRARHRGRLQRRESVADAQGGVWPAILLDGAHNPMAAETLEEEIPTHLHERPRILLFGAKHGKNHATMLRTLASKVDGVVLTRASEGMEFDVDLLTRSGVEHRHILYEPDLKRAVQLARDLAGPSGGMLVTGSLYLVGDTLKVLDEGTVAH